jgi:hypothetical protein
MQDDISDKNPNVLSDNEIQEQNLIHQLSDLFLQDEVILTQINLSDNRKDKGETLPFDLLTDNLCEV